MVEKYARAQRRSDRARLKTKRQFHWGYGRKDASVSGPPSGGINFMSPGVAGGVVNTPTPCSCWMCGNPRRSSNNWADSRLTMQERKALASYIDQVEECDGTAVL
jgi:hypothetical protein